MTVTPLPSAASGPPSFSWWAFDPRALAAAKDEQGLRVSVCLPARDEATTVGAIVEPVRRRLVDRLGLVDDLVVIDDHSSDATAAVAAVAGARVVRSADILTGEGPGHGKGDVIWKSIAACDGDVICWIDADIRHFDLHFVTGLLGPLLVDPGVQFVKGHYRRPLNGEPTGGGRVTELLARPLLQHFFPELGSFVQPLAGEYAGRRALLEALPIVEGWGVEIGLLIDAVRAAGVEAVAQVDLGVRTHRNRPLQELAPQATAVLHTVLRRAGVEGDRGAGSVRERPPMASVNGYRRRRAATAPLGDGERTPLHIVGPVEQPPGEAAAGPAGFDRARAVAAVRELLEAVGEDLSRDGLERTPERVADMYAELFAGVGEDPADHLAVRFEVDHDELVLVRDIPFASVCEHHLMPFVGVAHVGYIPGIDGKVTGLSKLARLIDGFARRPQVQERLTAQAADALETALAPRGVIVVVEAEHLCMTMRGVRKPGAVTVTSAVRGVLRDDPAARAEAMSMIHPARG